MSYVNAFLMQLTVEASQKIYDTFMLLCVIVYVPYLWHISRSYILDKKDRWLTFVICPLFCMTTPFIAFGAENGEILPRSSGNGVLMGIALCILASQAMHKSVHRCCDIVMPLAIASRTTLRMGCCFTGCCHGEPVEWGLYSLRAGTTTVPAQAIEVVVSVVIFCTAMISLKRRNYSGDGIVGSRILIAFGVLRFITDMLRPNGKFFLRTSLDGIVAIGYIVLGVVLLNWKEQPVSEKKKSTKKRKRK